MSLRSVLPEGGNWEGGERDHLGREWHHEPNVGWRVVERRWIVPSEPHRPWWRRWARRAKLT